MSYAVLVLTDDNFAPVNVSDDRLSHGFSLNEDLATLHDWRLSPYASRTMALGVLLGKLVRLTPDEIYGAKPNATAREPKLPALSREELHERELWAAARFYTLSELSALDSSYICAHFDAICFFFNHPLTAQSTIAANLNSLLLSASCPPTFIFNLCLRSEELTPSVQLFLAKVVRNAQLVHALEPSRALPVAPRHYLACSHNAFFMFQAPATKTALVRLSSWLQALERTAGADQTPVIALSSSLFTRHAHLGLAPASLQLLTALTSAWPQARIIVVMGKSIFSYAPLLSDATYLGTEQGHLGEHWCQQLNAVLQRHALTQAQLSGQPAPSVALSGVFLGHSYEEYRNFFAQVDLVITEFACEQILAASCGTATLGLTLDFNLEEPVAQDYYATYSALQGAEVDAAAYQAAAQAYEALALSGLLSSGAKVGSYQELSPVSFGCSSIFPCLKFSTLTQDLQAALDQARSQLTPELLLGRPDELKQAWREALGAHVTALHPQEQLMALRHAMGLHPSPHQGSVLQVAQRANFTSTGRYEVQWQALKALVASQALPSELTIMSFGCSTGQELCELRTLLGSHHYIGVDLNEDALVQARLLWQSLEQLPYVPQAPSVRFMTTAELLTALEQVKCDVICAMTVLCRHPDTVLVANAKEIYDSADFSASLELLDQALNPGGLLCLFNTNYCLEDTALGPRYQRLFPVSERLELVKLLACSPALATALDQVAQQGPQSLTAALFGYVPTFKLSGERMAQVNKGTIFRKLR